MLVYEASPSPHSRPAFASAPVSSQSWHTKWVKLLILSIMCPSTAAVVACSDPHSLDGSSKGK